MSPSPNVMRLSRLTLVLPLLAGGAAAQEQRDVAQGALPPIERSYKAKIGSWARQFFVEPSAVGNASISDPVLIRDGTGRLLWLVCVEATNGAPSARPPGVERYAFGFAASYFTAPLERRGSTLTVDDCEQRPLVYRRFPGFPRT